MPLGIGVLMDILTSPFGQLMMTVFGGQELQNKQEEFNAESQKTLDDILAGSKELEKRLSSQTQANTDETRQLIEDLANKVQGQFTGKSAELRAFFADLGTKLDTEFTERNKRVEGLLEGTNEQTIKDINRSFDTRQEALTQNLISSGLSGGTVGIEPAGLLERDRGDTIASARQGHSFNLANIIADLEGERIGTGRDIGFAQADFDRAFTGQQIDSDILLRGGGIESFNQGNQNLINIARDMGLFRFNTQANVQRIPPQSNFLLNNSMQAGQNSQGTPDTPGALETAAPSIIAAIISAFAGSDRESKNIVDEFDVDEALKSVENLKIDKWEYKDERGAEHVGPMAQDFHEEFGLGNSDKVIHYIDGIGVALAAIQGLKKQLDQRSDRIQMLENRIAAMEGAA